MTTTHFIWQGGYRACNRGGIEDNASPLLKISFETAAHFLTEAVLQGASDNLASPAARLVLGRPVGVGTGAVHLIQVCGLLHMMAIHDCLLQIVASIETSHCCQLLAMIPLTVAREGHLAV